MKEERIVQHWTVIWVDRSVVCQQVPSLMLLPSHCLSSPCRILESEGWMSKTGGKDMRWVPLLSLLYIGAFLSPISRLLSGLWNSLRGAGFWVTVRGSCLPQYLDNLFIFLLPALVTIWKSTEEKERHMSGHWFSNLGTSTALVGQTWPRMSAAINLYPTVFKTKLY